jgi:4-amino-4-deoxy-L-arabinose transferase-like glycosyltransferase
MEPNGTVNVIVARENRSRCRDQVILLLVGAVLFFWRLGSRDLWPPDEPRFALVAHEMRQRGDYVVLSLNDRLYTDKPPLFFWAINGMAWLSGGVDELSARLPSAIAALITLLLIHRLGTWLYDRRTGLWAALVFATSLQIALRARWVSIDMTLNLLVLAAILLLRRTIDRPAPARADARWAWILMGLATLAKGPVGMILPLLAVLPSVAFDRDAASARRIFAPSGILLYLAVTLSWFGLFARRLGPALALQVLVHQNVDRYLNAWNVQHPFWYYLWRFPAGFLPWILLFPWSIAQALGPEERDRRRSAIFLLGWFIAILVFFSFSTGKRGVYIIPLYPAAAIFVGRLLARSGEGSDEGKAAARWLRVPLFLWAFLGASLTLALPYLASKKFPAIVPAAAAISLAFLAGGIAAWVLARRGRAGAVAACLAGSTLLALLMVIGWVVPAVNSSQNIRAFALRVREYLEPGVPFASTEQKREEWVFYTGRFAEPVDTKESLLHYLTLGGPRDLLIEEEKLRDIRAVLPPDAREVLRGRVGDQDYHLLRLGSAP